MWLNVLLYGSYAGALGIPLLIGWMAWRWRERPRDLPPWLR